ncbi:MAG: MFS transporter [Planctomycetota bacterium]
MIQRALDSFHPAQQPWGTRKAFRQELLTSATLPVAVAMLDAGVVGVFGKVVFGISNTQFAMISAAPMFVNVSGIFWTRASMGRRKTAFSGMVMSVLLMLIAAVAVLPTESGGWGPWALVGAVVLGRTLMAGVVTLRSAVWRMNFPRYARARITGKFVLIATLLLAVVPVLVGPLLDLDPRLFRVIYPIAAAVGIVGVVAYTRIRVRQEPQLLRSERRPHEDEDMPTRADGRPHNFVSVLREDNHFRAYMTWQFFAGVANMMGNTAFLLFVVEAVKHRDDANQLGMALGTTVPLAVATLTVPLWSKLLDRTHIAKYRISHGLTWVFGQSSCYAACLAFAATGWVGWFFIPMILRGVMQGGGMIAWTLGHNDFADKRLAGLYMGIHQTLTGVRGAFAPFLGVWLLAGWEGFTWWGGDVPPWEGIGPQVFIITTLFAVVAWLGFWSLSQKLEAQGMGDASDG